MKRKITITVETEQLLLIRRPLRSVWCPTCAAQVEPLTSQEAATLLGISVESLARQVQRDLTHLIETADGQWLICPCSLLNSLSQGEEL